LDSVVGWTANIEIAEAHKTGLLPPKFYCQSSSILAVAASIIGEGWLVASLRARSVIDIKVLKYKNINIFFEKVQTTPFRYSKSSDSLLK
jgi:hypothetical protein